MKRAALVALAVTLLAMWVAPVLAQDAKVEKGKKLFADQKCTMCHSIGGQGGKVSALDGVGAKLKVEEIKKWITDPKAAAEKAGSTKKPPMKAYPNLAKEDLDALVAYVSSLKK